MDDELRMKLADLGAPEALADCIISHFSDIKIPIPLARIAEAVGIVEVIGKKTDAFEGVLVTDAGKSKGSIAYNEASAPERQRFTIAHELGHFLLPFHGANAQCAKADLGVMQAKDPNRAREAEANRFAASLLMPKSLFLRSMRRLGSPEAEHIVKLAADYEVSKEAAARRYTELCDEACAVVFSHRGKLRYSCRHKEFPFIDLRTEQPLPSDAISARSKCEPGHVSEWSESSPDVWLGESHRARGKVVYEQYYDQANGYRLSMLTLDNAAGDDESDEDGEFVETWRRLR